MSLKSVRTGLVLSLLLSLGACGAGQDNKTAAKTSAASPDQASTATDHSIPLPLWVDDVVENDTNETAQPLEIDTELSDTEDAKAFNHYFAK